MSDSQDKSSPFRNDLRSQLVAAGTAAAEQWLTDRANRKMSDVNRRRLAGHVVNALWSEIERAAVEIAQYVGEEQLTAANARAEKAERQRSLAISLSDRRKWERDETQAEMEQLRGERDELARVAMQRGEQAAKWGAQLAALGETRDALKVAMELLDRLASEEECELWPSGCQTHGGYPAPCPHPLARQLVAAWREVEQEAPHV